VGAAHADRLRTHTDLTFGRFGQRPFDRLEHFTANGLSHLNDFHIACDPSLRKRTMTEHGSAAPSAMLSHCYGPHPAIAAAQAFASRALRMYPVSGTSFQTAIAA